MTSFSILRNHRFAAGATTGIAIIGGGASGTLVAINILRRASSPIYVVIIESSEQLGRGIAYGTRCPRHLLNVRAEGMSAYPERPSHFTEWLRQKFDPGVSPQSFVPRSYYGEYLESELHQ